MMDYPVERLDRNRDDPGGINAVSGATASEPASAGLRTLLSRRRGLASRIRWPLVRQAILPFVAIYLIGGAIMFNVQLLEFFDCATPITVGGAALLIAFLAKLVVRDEF